MKALIIIMGFILCSSFSKAQDAGYPIEDSLELNSISGTDTILYFKWFQYKEPTTVEFDYTAVDTDDAVLDIGYSNYDDTFNSVEGDFPFTLDKTTNGYTNNDGTTKATIGIEDLEIGFKYLCIKFSKGTVGAAKYVTWKYVR